MSYGPITPEIIEQAYADAEVSTVADMIAGIEKSIENVEARIAEAYQHQPRTAFAVTAADRQLLKAQLSFLEYLTGQKR